MSAIAAQVLAVAAGTAPVPAPSEARGGLPGIAPGESRVDAPVVAPVADQGGRALDPADVVLVEAGGRGELARDCDPRGVYGHHLEAPISRIGRGAGREAAAAGAE